MIRSGRKLPPTRKKRKDRTKKILRMRKTMFILNEPTDRSICSTSTFISLTSKQCEVVDVVVDAVAVVEAPEVVAKVTHLPDVAVEGREVGETASSSVWTIRRPSQHLVKPR